IDAALADQSPASAFTHAREGPRRVGPRPCRGGGRADRGGPLGRAQAAYGTRGQSLPVGGCRGRPHGKPGRRALAHAAPPSPPTRPPPPPPPRASPPPPGAAAEAPQRDSQAARSVAPRAERNRPAGRARAAPDAELRRREGQDRRGADGKARRQGSRSVYGL